MMCLSDLIGRPQILSSPLPLLPPHQVLSPSPFDPPPPPHPQCPTARRSSSPSLPPHPPHARTDHGAQAYFFGGWVAPLHLLRPSARLPPRVQQRPLPPRQHLRRGRRGRRERRRGPLRISPTLHRRSTERRTEAFSGPSPQHTPISSSFRPRPTSRCPFRLIPVPHLRSLCPFPR